MTRLYEDIFKIVAQLPDIFNFNFEEVDSQEWDFILKTIQIATQNCNTFRENEGFIFNKSIPSLFIKYSTFSRPNYTL